MLVDALRYARRDPLHLPCTGSGSSGQRSTLPTMRPSGRRPEPPAAQRGPGARRRPDPAWRRLAGRRDRGRRIGRRAGRHRRRSAAEGRGPAARFRRRLGRGVGDDPACGAAGARHGQAGGGVDEQHRGLRRLLDSTGRRPHRGAARHAHGLDRRGRRQARCSPRPGASSASTGPRSAGAPTPASGRSTSPIRREAKARVDALVGWLYGRFTSLVADGGRSRDGAGAGDRQGRVWAGEGAGSSGWSTSWAASTWRWRPSRRALQAAGRRAVLESGAAVEPQPPYRLLRLAAACSAQAPGRRSALVPLARAGQARRPAVSIR